MYFLDSAVVLRSRNTDIRFSRCVKARSPTVFGMTVSVLTACIPANAHTLLAGSQLQKLNHKPPWDRTLQEVFGKPIVHESPSLTPPSFSKALQNDIIVHESQQESL